ncbi:MAG: hypothetical protein V1792_08325 [Pseudomonadota bacterium]
MARLPALKTGPMQRGRLSILDCNRSGLQGFQRPRRPFNALITDYRKSRRFATGGLMPAVAFSNFFVIWNSRPFLLTNPFLPIYEAVIETGLPGLRGILLKIEQLECATMMEIDKQPEHRAKEPP